MLPKCLAVIMVMLLGSAPAFADTETSQTPNPTGTPTTAPLPANSALPTINGALPRSHFGTRGPVEESFVVPFYGTTCTGNTVFICGASVMAPASPFGAIVNLTVPSPYIHQGFTAQCMNYNGFIGFQVLDASAVTCTLQTCTASSVNLCSWPIAVAGGTSLGNSIDVPVPTSALSDASNSLHMHFTAQCVESSDGTAVYQVTNLRDVSCNQFPCPDSTIRLCGTSVPVKGGAAMGEVLQMKMPAPFAPDPFAVQCLGSNGEAPTYQLTDGTSVTCTQTIP